MHELEYQRFYDFAFHLGTSHRCAVNTARTSKHAYMYNTDYTLQSVRKHRHFHCIALQQPTVAFFNTNTCTVSVHKTSFVYENRNYNIHDFTLEHTVITSLIVADSQHSAAILHACSLTGSF